MPDTIRVCCVGPDLASTSEALESHADSFTVTHRSALTAGIVPLDRGDADCLVAEIDPTDPGDSDGLALLRTVRDRDPTFPVVLLTDDDGTGTDEAIAAGVTDFHPRSTGVASLASRIELALRRTGPDPRTNRRGTASGVSRSDDAADGPVSESAPELAAFRPFVERIAAPVYVLDDEGTCVAVNDALLEYTGYERSRVEGSDVDRFIDDAGVETATSTIETLLERADRNRDAFDVTIRTTDGERRTGEVNVTVVTDDAGGYVGSVGVVQDVTERRERIRELARYEAIVETAPIGLLALDEDGDVLWHNGEFTADLGIAGRDLVGTEFEELVTEGYFPDATLENYFERVDHLRSDENDDERIAYEEEWVDDDGVRGITEVNMGLLPLEDGEFTGTVYAFRNITERVRYQDELERQNDRLEKFASLVSHDLRNPLNVAKGHLDLLATDCESDSIDETRWAIDRMEELIDDLLALARYGRTVADRDRLELADVAEAAWAGVDTADASLLVDLDGRVSAHEGRVRELFENLFRNAVEHGGESVTVTVGRLTEDGDAAGFFVEDDGAGLPDVDGIFEFGRTTADDGTGLGLGIVSEIADAHGWRIDAREGSDGGARFEIRGVTRLEEPAAE